MCSRGAGLTGAWGVRRGEGAKDTPEHWVVSLVMPIWPLSFFPQHLSAPPVSPHECDAPSATGDDESAGGGVGGGEGSGGCGEGGGGGPEGGNGDGAQ